MPQTNVLIALQNAVLHKVKKLPNVKLDGTNRMNDQGTLLEYLVKDLFVGTTIGIDDKNSKITEYGTKLSYLGATNNPPDFIIRKGAAVEVKKKDNRSMADIQLNSSFPKDYLYSDDPLLLDNCVTCEEELGNWIKKDMIYAIGNVSNGNLLSLFMVYGNCFCADRRVYQRIKDTIKNGVEDISGIQFTPSKELGKVRGIDSLDLTALRIRGMWTITNPYQHFQSHLNNNWDKTRVQVLMTESDYNNLKNKADLTKELNDKSIIMKSITIPDPNNAAKTLKCVLFIAEY